jgi:hypothetical protein
MPEHPAGPTSAPHAPESVVDVLRIVWFTSS